VTEVQLTVASRCKASTVFARSDTGILGSNPTGGMDDYVCLFCVCAVLCVVSGLVTPDPTSNKCLQIVYRVKKLK
jgi:hypothetical protein